MSKQTHNLHLTRVDATRNMARFYELGLQPTLFGEVSLLRAWGRIGTIGRCKVETFAADEQAGAAFARLERIKRRRGYR